MGDLDKINYGHAVAVDRGAMAHRAASHRAAGGGVHEIRLRPHTGILREIWQEAVQSVDG